MNSLEPSHLPQAFLLVLFAVALSYFYNLRAERDLLESSIRTTVQLLLVGYVLQFVLKVQSSAFLVLILFLMSIFGSTTATVIILCLWKRFINFTDSQRRNMKV
jgi:putative ABC transport system permease protein